MTNTSIKLKIPTQDLEAPSGFSASVRGVTRWLDGLTDDTLVEDLSMALEELNRCKINAEARYDIAELLRPQVEKARSGLARLYLNQSPLISKESLHEAERADKLCTLLGTAYTVSAVEVLTDGGVENAAKLACEAIYRSLCCSGQEILQSMQLYRPLHIYGWMNLHQLYALAEQQNIADLPVPDPISGAATITSAYLQSILLCCCQPNRLRQADLAALQKALADWAQHAELVSEPKESSLFVVDIDSDQPPLYRHLVPEEVAGRRLFLNTDRLLRGLRELMRRAEQSGATIEKESRLPLNILEQVISALGEKRSRSFKRLPTSGSLSLSLGLNNCHFHVASGLIFEQVLYGAVFEASKQIEEERFTPPLPHTDIWHQANPVEDGVPSAMNHPDESIELDDVSRARVFRDEERDGLDDSVSHYPIYQAPLADVSPGGYCLELDPAFPGELRTGEVVCLREGDSSLWQIAAIRWLHMPSESRLLAGLELLSPRARAYGACIHEESGDKAPPTRALLLPEIKLVGQPPTLLTPRAGFRVRQRLTLVTAEETQTVQLTELISYTGSYSQFEFKPIRELGDVLAEENNELTGGDDSLWTTL